MGQHTVHYNIMVPSEVPFPLTNKKVLDCGCGRGVWGYLMRSTLRGDKAYIVGLDITREYLRFCKKYRVYDDLIVADAAKLPFKNAVFDITLAVEMMEHLFKNEGQIFLKEVELITKEKIILTTPHGYWPKEAGITAEIHRSRWYVKDFKKRGYRVHGMGLKGFDPNHVPFMLYMFTRFFFTPLTYFIPWLSECLIAVKEKTDGVHKV